MRPGAHFMVLLGSVAALCTAPQRLPKLLKEIVQATDPGIDKRLYVGEVKRFPMGRKQLLVITVGNGFADQVPKTHQGVKRCQGVTCLVPDHIGRHSGAVDIVLESYP